MARTAPTITTAFPCQVERSRIFIHLFSVSNDQFDSIIIIWVMTGGDHDSAVKIICSCHIGNGWGCGYMKQVCICPGSYQTTYQRVFKHIAGSPGIFSDDDPCRCIIPVSAFLFSVVPAQDSADITIIITSGCLFQPWIFSCVCRLLSCFIAWYINNWSAEPILIGFFVNSMVLS